MTITIEQATIHEIYDDCREEMIARHYQRERDAVVKNNRGAGKYLVLTGGG